MKKSLAVIFSLILAAAAVMAEDKKPDGSIATTAALRVDSSTGDGGADAIEMEAVEPVKPVKWNMKPEIPKNYRTQNLILLGALWGATIMDIRSSSSLDKDRYYEANALGNPAGQVATSLAATGAAFFIQKYGGRRMRWLSSALLAGGAAAHTAGAVHNYSLK